MYEFGNNGGSKTKVYLLPLKSEILDPKLLASTPFFASSLHTARPTDMIISSFSP